MVGQAVRTSRFTTLALHTLQYVVALSFHRADEAFRFSSIDRIRSSTRARAAIAQAAEADQNHALLVGSK